MSILLSASPSPAPNPTGLTTQGHDDPGARTDSRPGTGSLPLTVVRPVALQASRTSRRNDGYRAKWHIASPAGTALCNQGLKLLDTLLRDPSRTLPRQRCRHEACASRFTAEVNA